MDNLNDYAEEIKNLFRSINKKSRNYVLSQVGHCSFTVPQIMVMQELYSHPDITLKELSELMGLAKSTVCGIIDRLETQGAVIRKRDTEDRRAVKISLAPKMSEITDSINVIKKNYVVGLLRKVETSEVEKIVYGLRKLNALMEDHKQESDLVTRVASCELPVASGRCPFQQP